MAPLRLTVDFMGIQGEIIFGSNGPDGDNVVKTHVYLPNDHFIFCHKCEECENPRNIFRTCVCSIQHIYKMASKPSPCELTYIEKGNNGVGTVGWYEYTHHINDLFSNFSVFVRWILDPETERNYRQNSTKILGTQKTDVVWWNLALLMKSNFAEKIKR